MINSAVYFCFDADLEIIGKDDQLLKNCLKWRNYVLKSQRVSKPSAVLSLVCDSGEALLSSAFEFEQIGNNDGGIVIHLFNTYFDYGLAFVNTVQLHGGYDAK